MSKEVNFNDQSIWNAPKLSQIDDTTKNLIKQKAELTSKITELTKMTKNAGIVAKLGFGEMGNDIKELKKLKKRLKLVDMDLAPRGSYKKIVAQLVKQLENSKARASLKGHINKGL